MNQIITQECFYCFGKRIRGTKECKRPHEEQKICSILGCTKDRDHGATCEDHHREQCQTPNRHYKELASKYETEREYAQRDTKDLAFY